jgi:nucleotide-binding universal stress UspA family protein
MNTKSIKKVLIALDYNPTAQKVAETGFSLGKSLGAEIVLLHVISYPLFYPAPEYSPIMGFNGYMDMGQEQKDSIEGLKESSGLFLEKSKIHLGDENIKILVKSGDFADTILETAKELGSDIIIMGSHSRKWLENIVMGSVTEKVLHHTTIPLIIIPTGHKK